MSQRFTNGSDVVTVPDALAERYKERGWEPVKSAEGRKLESYTVAELKGMADAQRIELAGADTKAEIIAKLTQNRPQA